MSKADKMKVFEEILKSFNIQGTHFIMPYKEKGIPKRAVINLNRLYRIIQWNK